MGLLITGDQQLCLVNHHEGVLPGVMVEGAALQRAEGEEGEGERIQQHQTPPFLL